MSGKQEWKKFNCVDVLTFPRMAHSQEGSTYVKSKVIKANHLFDSLLWRAEEAVLHDVPPPELRRSLVREMHMERFEHDVLHTNMRVRLDIELFRQSEEPQPPTTKSSTETKRATSRTKQWDLRKRRKLSETKTPATLVQHQTQSVQFNCGVMGQQHLVPQES